MATEWAGADGAYSTAGNWNPSGVPIAAEDVRIPASSSQAISSGLDQSAVAIGDWICEEGYSAAIGTAAADLQIDPDRFEWAGTGASYIDLGTAAIDALITAAATASTGNRGLYLKGSAIATLVVTKGKVGLASRPHKTATVTTVRVVGPGADLWIGEGVTLTTLTITDGVCRLRCAATTVNVEGGTLYTEEVGTITTLNVLGGTVYPHSTGTITTFNAKGGFTDFRGDGRAKTVTTFNQQKGSIVAYDPDVVTITNRGAPDDVVVLSAN